MGSLQTERLLLRPWTMDEGDLEGYCDLRMDEEIADNAGWFYSQEPYVCELWLQDEVEREDCWAIVLREHDGTVGYIDLHPDGLRPQVPGVLAVGFALVRCFWGKGIMAEALDAVLHYALTERGLEQVTATHDDGNERCRRVLERCGFRREGVLRRPGSGQDDDVVYSILREELLDPDDGKRGGTR